jgi:rod shape-determining protein MreB
MSNLFYVGIDLGTSRSSIATSTGKRISTRTCVGYPKDVISRKRFGKDYLFGDEAIDNRLALNLIWPLADGVICEEEKSLTTTGLILKHLIDQAIPERQESDKIYAAIGVPAQASIRNKKAIIEVAQDFLDKILIVSEPFTVAYSIDRFDECLIVDIGAGTTDLCRMHGSMPEPEDQITLKAAGNFLDDVLMTAILEKFPDVQLTPQIVRRIKEKHGYVSDTSDLVKVTLTKRGIPAEYDLTAILRESCLKLTKPISKAIQELVGTFDPEFQERLRNNVIIAGGGSRLKGLEAAVEKSLLDYGGGDAICVQDAEYCGSEGALKMCVEMPDEYWEKI